jgi:hypothetical protein
MLPSIPFNKIPHKVWKDEETEKKARLETVQHNGEVFHVKRQVALNSYEMKMKEKLRRPNSKSLNYGSDDDDDEGGDDSGHSSDESSEYDLLEHIKDLLPGDIVNGEKPKKIANTLHLQDLKPVKKRWDYLYFAKLLGKKVEELKARERERRKHHLLRHFEEQVKKYDEQQKKNIHDAYERLQRERALEELHRLKRIERNSKKVSLLSFHFFLFHIVTNQIVYFL